MLKIKEKAALTLAAGERGVHITCDACCWEVEGIVEATRLALYGEKAFDAQIYFCLLVLTSHCNHAQAELDRHGKAQVDPV